MARYRNRTESGVPHEQDGGAPERFVELVTLVKQKRELANLDERHVLERVERYYRQNAKERAKLLAAKSVAQFSRSKEFDAVRRVVRDDLRKSYGVFNLERRSLTMTADELLMTHQSTKERLPSYGMFYERIFAITGKPRRVLDLGCGMNPVAYEYLGCKPVYAACDISSEDMAFLNAFFKRHAIPGEAFVGDLLKDHETVIARSQAFTQDVVREAARTAWVETQDDLVPERAHLSHQDSTGPIVTRPPSSRVMLSVASENGMRASASSHGAWRQRSKSAVSRQ